MQGKAVYRSALLRGALACFGEEDTVIHQHFPEERLMVTYRCNLD